MATKIAQYSLSPPARPFHIRTYSICQLLTPGGEIIEKDNDSTYHGDASCQTHKDKADAEFRLIGEKCPRKAQLVSVNIIPYQYICLETHHQERCNNPVNEDAEEDLFPNLPV